MLLISDILDYLEEKFSPALAEKWDNVGLQVGSRRLPVHTVMTCLTPTEAVVDYAIAAGVELIVAHHPLIFRPLSRIATQSPLGRILNKLLTHEISLYVLHTNLDKARNGLNDWLAEALGLTEIRVLQPEPGERLYKIVVFVPEAHSEIVREAMARAGAGHLGRYSDCFFQARGSGTFRPLAGTQPYIGTVGQLEKVAEVRLETVARESQKSRVLQAMLAAHPYEEVAFDVYPLLNETPPVGVGRIGCLPSVETVASLAKKIKEILGVTSLRIIGEITKQARRVAVCGGSGSDYWQEALRQGADVLVTGDVKYHTAVDVAASSLAVIDAGHFGTEIIAVRRLAELIQKQAQQANWNLQVLVYDRERDPVITWGNEDDISI